MYNHFPPDMMSPRRIFALVLAAAFAAGMAGCASERPAPVPEGPPPAEAKPEDGLQFVATDREVASQDLVAAADLIARGVAGIPEIAGAKSTPRIVLAPVDDRTQAPVDAGQFLSRMRILLNENAMNKARFLDRAMMARIAHQPDYQIAGRLEDPAGPQDYVLYRFQLTDARTGALLWKDTCQIKKESLESE